MRTERVHSYAVLVTLVGLAAGSGGCSTMNNTEKGVGLGAAVGGGVGTLVGAATGNPKTGAVAGALIGGGVGGAVGNDMDRQDEQKREIRQATAIANAQAQPKMGFMDVVQMVQAGHDPQVIINQIRSTGSTFQLSQADLDYLKTYNVPPTVIVEMQNARPHPILVRQPRPVVVREEPVVIYERPAPIFVGGYYRRW